MKRLSHTVLKNALVNSTRIGVGALVALVLPPLLTHVLDRDRFAAWSLLLQIAAYANYIDFGIQTAVARFVAQATERGDEVERDGYISAAFFMLAGAGLLGFCVLCGMAALVPHLYKQAPSSMLTELRQGLIVLAGLSALALPTSVFAGVFAGLHRNEYAAFAGGGGRLVGAGLVMLAVQRTHSLVVMAAIVGGTNLAAGVLQYVLARRLLPTMQVSFQRMTKVYLQSLAKFCAGMGVMQFGMFLVSGLDLTIVGYFSFSEVGYYALASNALMLMTASANAAQGALVAPIASIHARGEEQRLASVVLKATYYLALLLTLLSILFIALGMTGLKLWVGPVYAHATVMILYVLVLGNALRLLILPYNAAVVAVGQHVRVAFTPVAEGVLNLVVSVVAGWYLGAIGVAIGTLVGSAGGVAMCLFYVVPRITDVKVTAGELIRACTLPMAYFLPTVGAIYLYQHEHAQVLSAYTALLCAGVGLTALMFIRRFRGDTIAA